MFVSHLLGAFINGLKPVSNQPVELVPGQIVRATILKAFPGDLVQVQIGGQILYAKLNAPLEVGEQAWLQVLPKSHTVTLKIITDKAIERGANQTVSEQESLAGLLRGLGMKADRINVSNLKALIAAEIPLHPHYVAQALKILRNASDVQSTLQMIQLSIQRNLPLTETNIQSLHSFFLGPTMEETISHLENIIKSHSNSALTVEKPPQIPPKANALIRNIVQLWNESSRLIHKMVSGTNDLTNDLMEEEHQLGMETNKGEHNTSLTESPTRNIPTEIKYFLRALGLEHERDLSLLSTRINQPQMILEKQESSNLKGMLLELVATDNLPKEVRETAEQGIRWITGQQLMFSLDTDNPWGNVLLQIPLPWGLRDGASYLQIEGRKGGKETIDPENCRLYFHLELELLKTTLIDIHIVNRVMSIHLYNDQPWVSEWVNKMKDTFAEGLKEMDYLLSSFKVSTLPKKEEIKQTIHPSAISTYRGVDIKI
jgi:hypothetical protein